MIDSLREPRIPSSKPGKNEDQPELFLKNDEQTAEALGHSLNFISNLFLNLFS